MVECELCGKKIEAARKVKVESSIISVCEDCAKFGSEVQFSPKAEPVPTTSDIIRAEQKSTSEPLRIKLPYTKEIPEQDFEIVDNFAEIIRNARAKMNLKQNEFAKLLNEKESVVSKLETGKVVPDDALAKKLERILKVKLRVPVESVE